MNQHQYHKSEIIIGLLHIQLWNIACKNYVQVRNIEIYFIATDQ